MHESTSPKPNAARRRWFEVFGGVQVANTRLTIVALLLGAIALAEACAIAMMAPLKTVVPYVIRVDKAGGVSAIAAAAQRFRPDQNQIAYGLARWVTNMLTLDRYLTGDSKHNNVLDAYLDTRGLAAREFDQWFRQAQPLKAVREDPSLTRVVHIRNWVQVQDGEMIFRVETVRRSMKEKPVTKHLQVAIHYIVVPPQTQEQIMANPLGLYVTDFAITEDLS